MPRRGKVRARLFASCGTAQACGLPSAWRHRLIFRPSSAPLPPLRGAPRKHTLMADWIIGFIEQHGYLAVLALMVAENIFPPVPSELIMPFAGFVAARGDLHPALVVIAGTLGTLLGTLPWYVVARRIGRERLKTWAGRHGRWLTVSPRDIDRASDWFDRHGALAVFLGRLVPAVRSLISAPAGFSAMALPAFLLWSVAGSLLWVGTLTAAGYLLDSGYDRVAAWIDPVTKGVLVAAVAAYVWRVVRAPSTT